MAGGIEPAEERAALLRTMPISVSQAQKVCGKEPLSTFLPAFSCNAQNAISSSKVSHWRFPDCSLRDKILHLFFVFCVLIMIACAAVTIICFKEVNNGRLLDNVFLEFSIEVLYSGEINSDVKVLISKFQCMLCFESCITEGRAGGKGGSANSKTRHTEPVTSDLILPLYIALTKEQYAELSTRTMQDRWSHRKRPSGIRVPGLDLTPINPNQFIKPISAMAAATVDSLEVKGSQNAIERPLR